MLIKQHLVLDTILYKIGKTKNSLEVKRKNSKNGFLAICKDFKNPPKNFKKLPM